jgi:hypothetical protein
MRLIRRMAWVLHYLSVVRFVVGLVTQGKIEQKQRVLTAKVDRTLKAVGQKA